MAEANVGVNFKTSGVEQVEAGFRRAGTAAKGFNKDANGISTALKGIAGYAAGFFSVYTLGQFFAGSARDAMEADAAMALLQSRLKKVGLEYSSAKPQIDAFANSMINLGRSDEETANAVGSLVTKTHNLDTAIKLAKLASDLAASGIGNYADNVDNLGKILIGRGERALIAFGIKLQTGATTTEQLNAVQKKVTRTTEQWAATTEGQVARMNTSWGELKEGIGNILLPSVNAAAEALNKLLNVGNEENSRSDWTKALGLRLEGAFKKVGVVFKTIFNAGSTGEENLKKITEGFKAIDDAAEKSMAAIIKGTDQAGAAISANRDTFDGVVDDMSGAAEKLQDAFRSVSKTAVDSIDEQQKAISNLRSEMKGLDRDLAAQLDKTKDRQKQELIERARQSQDKIVTLEKEIATTKAAMDKGWRTKVEELEKEKSQEQAIIDRIGGQITNVKQEIAKDDLTVLQEQHAAELKEIQDQAERKKLELQKEELEREKFVLEQAVRLKTRGFFSKAIAEAGTFLGSIGQGPIGQSFIFNFNGDVNDIDKLKALIISAINREATLRGVGGK